MKISGVNNLNHRMASAILEVLASRDVIALCDLRQFGASVGFPLQSFDGVLSSLELSGYLERSRDEIRYTLAGRTIGQRLARLSNREKARVAQAEKAVAV